MKLLGKLNPLIAALIALVILVALLAVFWPGGSTKHLVADFPRTVSLYKGSDVKILGIPVGKVESVTPAGTKVRVKLSYDGSYKLPDDAKAAVISPSIVGDRFVQLTPVYKSGAVLPDNAHLGVSRTATPLELDQIFGSLNDLDIALGPEKANKPDATGIGPLTRLLQSTAANFGGQGEQFHKTLGNLSDLTGTLSDNKDQFFATVKQLETFTNKLSTNDQTVRAFNDSLASGANLLAGERQDLAAALHNLSVAMTQVRGFVHDNRDALGSNIKGLNQISKILVKRRDALDQILTYAPLAANNLGLAYDANTGTLDTRDNVGELGQQLSADPSTVLCTFVSQAPGGKQACGIIQQALAARPRTAALQGGAPAAPKVVEPIDKTLGGLVGVSR